LINGTVNYNKVVPYLGFSGIKMSENAMNSHYNGLQMDFHGQIATGLTLARRLHARKAMGPRSTNGLEGSTGGQ